MFLFFCFSFLNVCLNVFFLYFVGVLCLLLVHFFVQELLERSWSFISLLRFCKDFVFMVCLLFSFF